jgi:hypothetical protein
MILLILIKILDLLIDAFYVLIWAAINSGLNWLLHWANNWLLRRDIPLHPSKLAWVFYWTSQGLFGLSTLVIIVLHAAKDIKSLRSGQHHGFAGIGTKFVDMARQTSALATFSTILIAWTSINWALEKSLDAFAGNDASVVTNLWLFAAELIFAAATLSVIVMPMYESTTIAYRRLFGTSGT